LKLKVALSRHYALEEMFTLWELVIDYFYQNPIKNNESCQGVPKSNNAKAIVKYFSALVFYV
jgi:hypothetical protein